MADCKTEMQKNIWKTVNEFLKNFTEIIAVLDESSSESEMLNLNESVLSHQDSLEASSNAGSYNTTIYATYPSQVLWFGAVCCILFAIIGTAGNFISILAMYRCKRLRNATTAFIVNLCVSDMLYCCFTMPLTAVTFIDRDWRNGDVLCKLFALVKFSNGIVSIFTVVAITINRYVLIVHPTIYPTVYSTKNTALGIACLWFFPLILIAFPLFNVWGQLTYNPKVGDCGVNNLNGSSPRMLIFVLIIVLPSVMFIACYLRIYFVVKNSLGSGGVKQKDEFRMPHRKTSESYRVQKSELSGRSSGIRVELRDKKEFRVLRIVLVIFIFYTASIFPISLMKLFRKEGDLPLMNVLAYIFFFSASVINPIVYIAMSREYRAAYKELLTSKICCN